MLNRVCFVCALMAVVSVVRAAPPPAPTYAEAKADYDGKLYRQALQKISKAITATNSKSPRDARYDLFVLRGECMLRLNERTLATDAFRAAARTLKNDGDVHKAATAAGTALLIEASRNLKYVSPRSAGAEPIDVVDPESRKKALSALFDDRFATTEPKASTAISSEVLPPMLDLLPTMRDLYVIEVAAKGEAPQTIPLLKTLGGRARELITAEVTRVNRRLDEIEDGLTREVYLDLRNIQGVRERGLSTAEQKELKETHEYLGKIAKVGAQGRWIARRLGDSGDAWGSILAECSETSDAVERLAARK